MDGMSITQQRKAINFSVCFLREEVRSMKEALSATELFDNEPMRKQAERRLAELEADLKTFEALHVEWDA